jgi:hypothetical protein
MPDNDDKKKKAPDSTSAKPTAEKPRVKINPFPEFDDFNDVVGGVKNAPAKSEPAASEPAKKDAPAGGRAELNRASAERTRNVRLNPNDQMRDYLGRIDQLDVGQDEIPDAELAPRANDPGYGEPEVPVEPNTLPDILHREVTVPGGEIEWHQVRNLPGYMKNAVRVIGRQHFGQLTRTPIEDITVIAHLNQPGMQQMIGHRGGPGGFNPQGPGAGADNFTSMAEMQQVGRWLENNAQRLGDPGVEHPNIPGYRAEIREYSAMGIRFHVVRDFMDNNLMGYYIYAWPEADSRNNNRGGNDNRSIGQDRPRLPRRESTEMKMKNSSYLTEQFKNFKVKYAKEQVFESIEQEAFKVWNEELIESIMINESSTLTQMLGDPETGLSQTQRKSGQYLIRFLHRRNKLSAEAPYEKHNISLRLMNQEFKSNPDNFVILVYRDGMAAVKPDKKHIERMSKAAAQRREEYNPARDNTMPFQILAYKGGEEVNPELFRLSGDDDEVDRDVDPRVMRARMGIPNRPDPRAPNTFDLLREQLGTLEQMWIARGAVDREKMSSRRPDVSKNLNLDRDKAAVINRIRPVLTKLGHNAISVVNARIHRANAAQNYDDAQTASSLGAKIKKFIAALNTTSDLDVSSYNSPLRLIVDRAFNSAMSGMNDQEKAEFMYDLAKGSATGLKPILDAIRSSLLNPSQY